MPSQLSQSQDQHSSNPSSTLGVTSVAQELSPAARALANQTSYRALLASVGGGRHDTSPFGTISSAGPDGLAGYHLHVDVPPGLEYEGEEGERGNERTRNSGGDTNGGRIREGDQHSHRGSEKDAEDDYATRTAGTASTQEARDAVGRLIDEMVDRLRGVDLAREEARKSGDGHPKSFFESNDDADTSERDKLPYAPIGCWCVSAPAPRWVTAAAVGRGLEWGWQARWMVHGLGRPEVQPDLDTTTISPDRRGDETTSNGLLEKSETEHTTISKGNKDSNDTNKDKVQGITIRQLSSLPPPGTIDIPYLDTEARLAFRPLAHLGNTFTLELGAYADAGLRAEVEGGTKQDATAATGATTEDATTMPKAKDNSGGPTAMPDEVSNTDSADDLLVGRVAVHFAPTPSGLSASLWAMGVAQPYTRRGVGSALVRAALDVARSQDAVEMTLNATEAGAPLYLAHGFEDVGLGQTWWLGGDVAARDRAAAITPTERALAESIAQDDISRLSSLSDEDIRPLRLLACKLTPAQLAAKTQSPTAVDHLIARGLMDLDPLSAWDLWPAEDHARARSVMAEYAAQGRLDDIDPVQNRTILHEAVLRDDVPLVSALLDAGARTDVKDPHWKSTAMGWARAVGANNARAELEARGVELRP